MDIPVPLDFYGFGSHGINHHVSITIWENMLLPFSQPAIESVANPSTLPAGQLVSLVRPFTQTNPKRGNDYDWKIRGKDVGPLDIQVDSSSGEGRC